MPTITFAPVTAKINQPYAVHVAEMPVDEEMVLSVTDPDGEEIEALLGIESDAEFETLESQQVKGRYLYRLKQASGEVLTEGSIEVTA